MGHEVLRVERGEYWGEARCCSELAKAIEGRNMKFLTAFHHAENWFFFLVWQNPLRGSKGWTSMEEVYHNE